MLAKITFVTGLCVEKSASLNRLRNYTRFAFTEYQPKIRKCCKETAEEKRNAERQLGTFR